MDKNTSKHTTNNPGVPILPGVNTPLVKSAPPRVVPAPTAPAAPAAPAPAPSTPEPKK